MSIYLDNEWGKVMKLASHRFVEIPGIISFEKEINTPFGKKKVLFARGTPSKQALLSFKTKAKEYSYGTITPKITTYNDSIFKELGYKRYDDHTLMIDLKRSEEELWKQLEKKSARWGVKTAQKNNLRLQEAKSSELKSLYKLYKETAEKGNLKPETFEFFKAVQEILVRKDLAKIFVVKKNKETVAGAILLVDSDHTMLHLTGSNEKGLKMQAMPFLYWNLILYSKKLKKKYFDIGGYDVEAKEGEKAYQINRFKKNFGGEIWPQPIYATNSKYIIARKLMKNFRFLKNLIKK